MAGITLTAELQDKEARARLAALLARLDNRRPLFKLIGERLQGTTNCSPPARG